MFEEDKEQEPYMGLVQISRVSGKTNLFDSEVTHNHFIALRIKTATRRRGLSTDWIHDDKEIIEIYLSEAQFASMITSLNMGSGTPCTLHWVRGEGYITPPEKPDDQTDLFHDEMVEKFDKALTALKALKEQPGINKKRQHEIDMIIQDLDSNTGFVADQFAEHMEHRTSKMKTEVEAYMNAFIHRAGLTALGAPETTDAPAIPDTSKDASDAPLDGAAADKGDDE